MTGGPRNSPSALSSPAPLVLAEGIAVGLSMRILPHNFNDLCRASINHLQGKTFRIYPDFPTGGIADFADYNNGERGGKIKVRARIEQRGKSPLPPCQAKIAAHSKTHEHANATSTTSEKTAPPAQPPRRHPAPAQTPAPIHC